MHYWWSLRKIDNAEKKPTVKGKTLLLSYMDWPEKKTMPLQVFSHYNEVFKLCVYPFIIPHLEIIFYQLTASWERLLRLASVKGKVKIFSFAGYSYCHNYSAPPL